MMGPGNYLCGCNPKTMEKYNYGVVRRDPEGHIVCPQHGFRLYGWRSVPKSDNHPGPKFPYLNLTTKEMEDRKLKRTPFPERKLNLTSAVEDKRDARDPEIVGREVLAKIARNRKRRKK